ncbi:MAG: glycerol kinase GlpK [Alphaproteobacteria bacterium]|nr:glycerol kinase GlpK [Alphaproteobacteria bacterium]
MTGAQHILAIDQGTTSSRAIVFDHEGRIVASSQREFEQHYPQSGWVEHDAEIIWSDTLAVSKDAIAKAGMDATSINAIGITNQRETVVLWDRSTGEPVHRAIVWQDRRTADFCRKLKADGHEPLVQERTGLLLDPYFSATKLAWLLDHVAGAREAASKGELAFGTIDCFLLWRLTGGKVHATDATNASRTMLFDIKKQDWDDDLLALLDIPRAILPEVKDCSTLFGTTPADLFGAPLPVTGIAGDQQAATVGQACFQPGMLKSTYGTGCFALLNTGDAAITSTNRLLTTTAYRLNGVPTFAIEGSIFVAGAAVQWLRDGLKLVEHAGDTEAIARGIADTGGVYLVPAFVGLGAPYWDPDARGALIGLTRDSGIDQVVRATLESVAYQTQDLMNAMAGDIKGDGRPTAVRVDGGMVANDWVCQFLADVLNLPVERPKVIETTALGAAYLAGLETGLYGSMDAIGDAWQLDRRFEPAMSDVERRRLYDGWLDAVRRVQTTT